MLISFGHNIDFLVHDNGFISWMVCIICSPSVCDLLLFPSRVFLINRQKPNSEIFLMKTEALNFCFESFQVLKAY